MAAPIVLAPLRVACPACGGAIHPVASRCRHCRRDIVRDADRAAPAAATSAAPRRSPYRPRLVFVAALMVVVAAALAVPLGVS